MLSRKSQAQVPSALNLQSSATLGTGSAKTHKEILDHQEDKDIRHALSGQTSKRKRKRKGPAYTSGASDDSGNDESDFDDGMQVDEQDEPSDDDDELGKSRSRPIVVVDSGFSTAPATSEVAVTKISSEVGSALKRDVNGKAVAPAVKKAKNSKVRITSRVFYISIFTEPSW